MRNLVLWISIALAACTAPGAPAQSCRCAGCGPSAAPAPHDRPFWDARSGRYVFYASRTQVWYSWQPETQQWFVVAPTPPGPAPAAPAVAAQPAAAAAPVPAAPHHHAPGLQPAPAAQAQAPYGGQRTCPVMDEELGAHGTPIPVPVRGQTIYVCCRGCVRRVQVDPDRYLAKVAADRARPGAGAPGR